VSAERYAELIDDLCAAVGLPDAEHVLDTRSIEVAGFDVRLDHYENDEGALYVNFDFGAVTAGRTATVFRLMLEANLLVYAQDQAQLGLDTDYGNAMLLIRIDMSADLKGEALADLLAHYAEHGRYWQQNILEANDERFDGVASGNFPGFGPDARQAVAPPRSPSIIQGQLKKFRSGSPKRASNGNIPRVATPPSKSRSSPPHKAFPPFRLTLPCAPPTILPDSKDRME